MEASSQKKNFDRPKVNFIGFPMNFTPTDYVQLTFILELCSQSINYMTT